MGLTDSFEVAQVHPIAGRIGMTHLQKQFAKTMARSVYNAPFRFSAIITVSFYQDVANPLHHIMGRRPTMDQHSAPFQPIAAVCMARGASATEVAHRATPSLKVINLETEVLIRWQAPPQQQVAPDTGADRHRSALLILQSSK